MLLKTNIAFVNDRKTDDRNAAAVRKAVGDPNAAIAFGDGTTPNDGVYVVVNKVCRPVVVANLKKAGLLD